MKRLIFALTFLLLGSQIAPGQALPTATRRGALQAGVYYVADFPDYTNSKFFGYGGFVDLDLWQHTGFEFDYRHATDTTAQLNSQGQPNPSAGHVPSYQGSYEGAFRYFRNYGRFNPYARGGGGRGNFEYPPYLPPAPQGVSRGTLGYWMVSVGAGMDYAVTRHITARADFEYQRWLSSTTDPGASPNNINGLPRGLTPIVYSGGLAWRFGYGNTFGSTEP